MSKPDDVGPVVLLEPSSAAKQVGVSASGLRRLAPLYEQVHGDLPRRGTGAEDKRARLWPGEAVERLRDARKLVELERCKTILEALRALQSGVSLEDVELEPGGRQSASDVATQQTLQRVLEEVTALRAEVAALRKDADRREQGSLPVLETRQGEPDPKQFGPLVRLAVWLETRLRGH